MKIEIVTAPTSYPVTLASVKEHMRVSITADDVYISELVSAATDYVEGLTSNKYVTQTWKYYIDKFPADGIITLPFGKVISVTHLKYTDTDDSEETFSTDYYTVDTVSSPGRIVLDYSYTWPTDTLRLSNPIEIQFVTGYTTVPYKVKQAIKIYCSHLYDNREPIIVGTTGRSSLVAVPMHFDSLLRDYCMLRMGG